MEFAVGMIVGSLISLTTLVLSVNHMISRDKKRPKPMHYDIEIKSRGKRSKGTLYLKERKDNFHVRA